MANLVTFATYGTTMCYVQWLDKRVVTLLSTKHLANTRNDAVPFVRDDSEWTQPIPRPAAVASYNQFMGGVDGFDHLTSSYSTPQL